MHTYMHIYTYTYIHPYTHTNIDICHVCFRYLNPEINNLITTCNTSDLIKQPACPRAKTKCRPRTSIFL